MNTCISLLAFGARSLGKEIITWCLALAMMTCPLTVPVRAELCDAPTRLLGKSRFERISVSQGLSQESVLSITQDQDGFIWVGTQDGLNRFDGYAFRVFRHDSRNPSSLSDNRILCLWVAPDGILWIGTHTGGLNRLDPQTGLFSCISRRDVGSQMGLSHNTIHDLAWLPQKGLLVGTPAGLDLVYTDTLRAAPYSISDELDNPLIRLDVSALLVDAQHHVWVGARGVGLLHQAAGQSKAHVISPISEDAPDLKAHDITAIEQGPNREIWVGTWGAGVFRFLPDTMGMQSVSLDTLNNGKELRVYDLKLDRRGRMWICCFDRLIRLDPASGAHRTYVHSPLDLHSLSDSRVVCAFEDHQELLWFGAWNGGINRFNPRTCRFQHIDHDPSAGNQTLSNSRVVSVIEAHDQKVWVGTVEGLHRLDPSSGAIECLRHPAVEGLAEMPKIVRSVYQDRKGRFWVTFRERGLFRLNPDTSALTPCFDPVSDDHPDHPGQLDIDAILDDPNGLLWLGTEYSGLVSFDPDREQYTHHFRHNPRSRPMLPSDSIQALALTPHFLWVGSSESGLARIQLDSLSSTLIQHQPDQEHTLSHNAISCFLYDSQGKLWVGTQGGGINLWTGAPDFTGPASFRNWNSHDGLASDAIGGILEDPHQCFWISTTAGLTRFDPLSNRVVNYFEQDGIQPGAFFIGSYHQGASGLMYFGGIHGLTLFDPGQIMDPTFVPPVKITELLLFNEPFEPNAPKIDAISPQPVQHPSSLTFHYRQNTLSFAFAGLDFSDPNRLNYAYCLQGWQEPWIFTSADRRFATFTNLDPGTYTFKVKAANRFGRWNPEVATLSFRVLPPPWRTWWAYALYTSVLLGMLWAGLQYQKRQMAYRLALEQNRELETLDNVVQTINQNVELEPLVHSVLDQVMVLFPQAEKSAFLMLDPEEDLLRVIAQKGYDRETAMAFQISKPDALLRYGGPTPLVEEVWLVQDPTPRDAPREAPGMPAPASMLTMSVTVNKQLAGFLIMESFSDRQAFDVSDARKFRRFRGHVISAINKARHARELEKTAEQLKQTHQKLVDAAHQAGMAEIAINILHNLGNILNTVNASVDLIERQASMQLPLKILDRIVSLLKSHEQAMAQCLADDRQMRAIPEGLKKISDGLRHTHQSIREEVRTLRDAIDRMIAIVAAQNEHASAQPMAADQDLASLIDEVLKAMDLEMRHRISIHRTFPAVSPVRVHKSKAVSVITHLLQNAAESLASVPRDQTRRIDLTLSEEGGMVQFHITDNGPGIPTQDRDRIFDLGYSSKGHGRGYGLHFCANAMAEMGGFIRCTRIEQGAGFTLGFPVRSGS